MLNAYFATGRLTREIELRYTKQGTTYTRFTLAIQRGHGGDNDKTDLINFVAWRKTAELLTQFTSKGVLITVQGYAGSNQRKNDDGTTDYYNDLIVNAFDLLESRQTTQARQQSTTDNGAGGTFNHEIPTPDAAAQPSSSASQTVDSSAEQMAFSNPDLFGNHIPRPQEEVEVNDDDLPF
jgi:single stranded DNA-binding protein (ssb)